MDAFFFILGRAIFAGFCISSGVKHFAELKTMSQYAESRGVPYPAGAVALTGIMLLLGGLSILLGAYPVLGIVLLAAFMVPVSVMMHGF